MAREIRIRNEVIKLGQLLKLADLVGSGSEVKDFLARVPLTVNGEPETRRGRQLHLGDVVRVGEEELLVCALDPGLDREPAEVASVSGSRVSVIEFPADDPARARRFWTGLLGVELQTRAEGDGEGWQSMGKEPRIGVHERGRGPGDSFSLPYFAVSDMESTLQQVGELGGSVIHPGERWAICKDSEGSPFGLAHEKDLD